MNATLIIWTYIEDGDDVQFSPNGENVYISSYKYSTQRNSVSPTIEATIYNKTCLDSFWTGREYIEFRDEKYFVARTPSSKKSNNDSRYVHEVKFVSERETLKDILFYDVIGDEVSDNKYVSNSTSVHFVGTIKEYVQRLNNSLKYRNSPYKVVIDDNVTNFDIKEVSFEDKYISEALQEGYNIYGIPMYFNGMEIHFGEPNDNLKAYIFEYGSKNSLLSVNKENKYNKIINSITGHGSSKNLPPYYPNESSTGKHDVTCSFDKSLISDINFDTLAKRINILDKAQTLVYYNRSEGESSMSTHIKYWRYDNQKSEASREDDRIEIENYNLGYASQLFPDATLKIDYSFELTLPSKSWAKIEVVAKVSNGRTGANASCKITNLKLYRNNEEVEAPTIDEFNQIRISSLEGGSYRVEGRYNYHTELSSSQSTPVSVVIDANTIANINVEPFFEVSDNGDTTTIPLSRSGISFIPSYSLEDGSTIDISAGYGWVTPMPYLMPSVYYKSGGEERYWNAIDYPLPPSNEPNPIYGEIVNDTTKEVENPNYNKDGEYYKFFNLYSPIKVKEGIVNFEDTKPTIRNSELNYILDVAFDRDDNNELDETGDKYLHPYFFVKLNKLRFNLFDRAIDGGTMQISMIDGLCASCTFDIGVNDANRNIVQVDENGALVRDDNGNIALNKNNPQDKQNDTSNNEVWIALMKDNKTYPVMLPDSVQTIKSGDEFVILNILMPTSYIRKAEEVLDRQLIEAMYTNNSDKFNFSIKLSRIYLANNEYVFNNLDENSIVYVKYDNNVYKLFVSSYTYTQKDNEPLPDISITLTEEYVVTKSTIQQLGDNIRKDVSNLLSNSGLSGSSSGYLVRKGGIIKADKNIDAEERVGISRANIVYDSSTNSLNIEEKNNKSGRVNLHISGGVSAKGIADFSVTTSGGSGSGSNITVLRDDELEDVEYEDITHTASAYTTKRIKDIINVDEIEGFLPDKEYEAGVLVKYNNKIYQFTYNHRGNWDSGIVKRFKLNEIANPIAISNTELDYMFNL